MGSQLAKSDSQHQTTSGRSSHQAGHFLRRAQEAKSLSSASTGSSSISSDRSAKTSSIVVVNSGPSASNSSAGQPHKRLPQLQRPLIPIGQIQVNPSFLHLSPQPIIDLGLEIEQELRKNAELVAHEQTKLVEKIRDIDSQVTASSVTIGAERQRRFNKAVDNFGKFDEIDALIQRCENDIENILTVFVQLNDALPDSLCLEQFALQELRKLTTGRLTDMLEFSSSGASLFGSPVNASVAGMNPNQANNAMSGSSIFSQFARSNSASSGSGNSMFNLLNTGTGTLGPPPPLDMNEFPSLGGSGGTINFSQSSTAGRQPYVGLLKDNVGVAPTSNEFSIQSEDFPALPGAPSGSGHSQRPTSPTSASLHAALAHHSFGAADVVVNQLGSYSTQQISAAAGVLGTSSSASNSAGTSGTSGSNVRPDSTESSQTQSSGTGGGASGSGNNSGSGASGAAGGGKKTSGVQLTKDGHLANIPPGMLTDQYGMAGLVALLANTESNQNLFSLAIGYDISSINLNLNSKERIYQTYPGPWNEKQLKPYEIDYPVPSEYLVHHNIRDKISEFKAPTYGDDLLFFLFYFFAGEQMQVYATRELYSREWRFHKDEGVWIRRMNSHMEKNPSGTYERGSYIYFDPINWMKMQKEMTVEYDRLESQPSGFQ